jgi:ribosomal protein RSM22 (predicted rRNA methylase)
MKHWRPAEVEILARLRARFLDGEAGQDDYWKSEEELRLYDMTFAERIGWKIDAALRALQALGWRPFGQHLIDWGCGSGIGARKLLSAFDAFQSVAVVDRSAAAVAFAEKRLRESHPTVPVVEARLDEKALLFISHVANELSEQAREELAGKIARAGEVLWVDAGTHSASRILIEVRERLLAMSDPPAVLGPCTHRKGCGMLAEENDRHWCHFFAQVPSAVFQDARWAEWSRELGIDLRVLPFSWMAYTRRGATETGGTFRVIGVPREAKGYCKVFACAEAGVTEWILQKRDAPALFRELTREREYRVQSWETREGRIVGEHGEG